jgi:F-type H+-transporting ATPase subunit delta
MSDLNISNRYAHALMNLADEKDSLSKISDDIELLNNTFSSSRQLQLMLVNPIIKSEKKLTILTELFKDKTSDDVMEFMKFVIHKNRENLLFKIVKQFIVRRDIKLGIINAKVISSVDISDEQKKILQQKLEDYTSKKVRISYSLDKKIIGGFIIKMDDTIIDASLKHQLDLLKEKFLEGSISVN